MTSQSCLEATAIRIVFWGTSEFALPSFETLLRHKYSIAGVVTAPDKPAERKQMIAPPPLKKYLAREKPDIPLFQPPSLKVPSFAEELRTLNPDLFVVAAYGKIIPASILHIPRLGALNIHPSLLPRWRGPSPIQYTILNGDTETGVTIIKMDELMDHGSIIKKSKISGGTGKNAGRDRQKSKITYTELHRILADKAAKLLIEILPKWVCGEIVPAAQDETQATYSKILKKTDGKIDWKKSAVEIERMIRAFNPWPGAWTLWSEKRIRIEEADVHREEQRPIPHAEYPVSQSLMPGRVVQTPSCILSVHTGTENLCIKKITLEGSRPMDAAQFIQGHRAIMNATLL